MLQDNKNKISDPKITQTVTQRLANRGIRSPSRINVTSASGQVTLSGNIQYEHQRQAVVHTTRAVEGVRRVVDMLKLIVAAPPHQKARGPARGPSPPEPAQEPPATVPLPEDGSPTGP